MSSRIPPALRAPAAVFFDLGGTILGSEEIDVVAGNARLLRHAAGLPPWSPEQVGSEASRLIEQLMSVRGAGLLEVNCRAFQRLLYDRLGIAFDIPPERRELEFWRGAYAHRPEPGIEETLRALRDAAVPCAVVSNSMFEGFVLEEELSRHGLIGYFRFVVSSADYGVRKPHPLLFDAALARMGCPASAAWYVGDRPEFDVAGALAAGMIPVWYNAVAADPPSSPEPAATVHNWDEFRALLAVSLDRLDRPGA